MTPLIRKGNAEEEGRERGGWFLGSFMEDERRSSDVEVKWVESPAGTQRPEWAPPGDTTTLTMLVRGTFVLEFGEGKEVVLSREGDYALWGPGIAHTWHCPEDCVLITVRWPSEK